MGKKNKNSAVFSIARDILVGCLVFCLVWLICLGIAQGIRNSPRFKIKEISYDPAISFMRSSRLNMLKGKSIFTVNLKAFEQYLQEQYPEISQIRLVRRFPDQIFVLARRRQPLAELRTKSKDVVVDSDGVAISFTPINVKEPLPIVGGLADNLPFALGSSVKSQDVQIALKIIKNFEANKYLAPYRIIKMDITNLSQIEFYMTDSFRVIVDQSNIDEQMRMLSFMLAQAKLKMDEVSYLDLRFKEPIISKKQNS